MAQLPHPRASIICFDASSNNTTIPDPRVRLLVARGKEIDKLISTEIPKEETIPSGERADDLQLRRARLAHAAFRLTARATNLLSAEIQQRRKIVYLHVWPSGQGPGQHKPEITSQNQRTIRCGKSYLLIEYHSNMIFLNTKKKLKIKNRC